MNGAWVKAIVIGPALLLFAICGLGAPSAKPRIFVTETTAPQVSGDATVGDARGSLAFTGGTSPQNVEAIKGFARYCPTVIVTANRQKADYLVQLDHEAIDPTTPYLHGNKVAGFR